MKNKKNLIIAIMICAALLMATGYAYFSTRLNINATGNITSNWNVYFSKITNGTIVGSASNNTTPSITSTTANIDVNLQLPGDSITYELTLTNGGTVGAVVEDIEAEAVGSTAIIYSISGIKVGDKIAGGASKVITIKVEYDPSFTSQPAITTKTLTVSIDVVQDIGQSITSGEIDIQEKTLAAAILKNSTVDGVVPVLNDFSSKSATSDPTFYQNVDYDGTTYFFRGKAIDNYVKFGTWNESVTEVRGYVVASGSNKDDYKIYDSLEACNAASTYNNNCKTITIASKGDPMYWRIVRINGDGTIRLVYDGTSVASSDPSAHVATIGGSAYNSQAGDAGYTYNDGTDSTIKTFLETWYNTNLKTTYGKYIADTVFCSDLTINEEKSSAEKLEYMPKTRIKTDKAPDLTCSGKGAVRYTVSTANGGNGLLNAPIGLLTADEISVSGAVITTANQYFYLYSAENIWTMAPYDYEDGAAAIMTMWYSGALSRADSKDVYSVRPVINLNADVKIASGNGTVATPYVIELN